MTIWKQRVLQYSENTQRKALLYHDHQQIMGKQQIGRFPWIGNPHQDIVFLETTHVMS